MWVGKGANVKEKTKAFDREAWRGGQICMLYCPVGR